MEPDQLLKLVINARDTLTLAPSPPIQFIAPSNLFSTPQSLLSTAPSSSLTPKMDRFRSIALSGDVITSTGSLNFFDSQYSFDIIFGDDPAMLILILRKKGQCATENTVYLISKVNDFCNLCLIHVFCDSVQLKYVGTDVYHSQKCLRIFPSPFRN